MAHLTEMERRIGPIWIPPWLQVVATLLVVHEWVKQLADYPDSAFRDYIVYGISYGFCIGFNYDKYSGRKANANMWSAIENPSVMQAYLDVEVGLGRVCDPVQSQLVPKGTQLSPFGVILKPKQPGRWRLIPDLSSLDSWSVNSGIEPELCSLQYLCLDEVIRYICTMEPGALLAKMDIETAYQIIPVYPVDRLYAVEWHHFL